MCVTRHAKSNQNKFAYLAISPEKHGGEADFLPADKRQRFLQSDNIILDMCGQACLNYPK